MMMDKKIYIDIFAGCGGLSTGLLNAGWKGLFAIEKNADAFSHAGLGLYIVQSVITMQNGECGVENLPEGVEFWFTLPQKQ